MDLDETGQNGPEWDELRVPEREEETKRSGNYVRCADESRLPAACNTRL